MCNNKWLATAVAAICLCFTATSWAQTKTLTIGFTASNTGHLEADSQPQLRGIELWRDTVNAAGGIVVGDNHYKIKLKHYDDQSSPGRVQQLYSRLILQDGADFLVSPYSSGLTATASIVSEQYGKIMMATGAAEGRIFKLGNHYLFQVYTPSKRYFTSALDLVKAKDPDAKVAMVYTNMGSGFAAGEGGSAYAKRIGLNVVLDASYAPSTTDFGPILNKVVASGADVLIGGGHFADGSTLARQLYDKKIDLKFICLQVAPANPKFASLGQAAFGVSVPTQWTSGNRGKVDFGPTTAQFVKDFTQQFGHAPEGYHAAAGYAAGVLLQHAIEEAGSIDTKAVAAALNSMDDNTFYGHIKFSTKAREHGLQLGHSMVLGQVQRDKAGKLGVRVVYPTSSTTVPLVFPLNKF